jgi:aryl-alcohol dehydrogenase (NADP+)
MKYDRLGTSGLTVSKVCLGGNSWGAAGKRSWAAFGPEESRKLIHHALDHGVNFFDTAPVYNGGQSEEVLGEHLVGARARDEIVVMTKAGFPERNPNRSGLGRKNLIASVEDSLRRLRTDHLDLLILHRFDPLTPLEETVTELNRLLLSGKVLYVGASTMPARHIIRLHLGLRELGGAGFVVVQNLYNLLYREDERELIPFCAEEGIALTPFSPLARGLLSGSREPDGSGTSERAAADNRVQEYASPASAGILETLRSVAERHGAASAKVALAWLWSRPAVVAPVVGVTKPHHVDDAVQAVELTLAAEELTRLDAAYAARAPIDG